MATTDQLRPADPDATPEAAALLKRLYRMRGRKILSAQHDYISGGSRYFDEVSALCGRSPSIWGGDLSFIYQGPEPQRIQHCGPLNLTEPGHGVEWAYAPERIFGPEGKAEFLDVTADEMRGALVRRCIAKHQAGHIITLMWHSPFPDKGDTADYHDLWSGPVDENRWRELVEPGTRINECWKRQLDNVVPHLRTLSDQKVPVLWRPYHEMNGAWFWWGNRRGENGYGKLWRMMFERMTKVHKLHNLIWVWNANAPRNTPGDEAYDYSLFYPGGDVVDVLATDIYHNDYRQSHYDGLLEIAGGRPVALGEVGHLPAPEILRGEPLWSWIMPWGGLIFRFNTKEQIRNIYEVLD